MKKKRSFGSLFKKLDLFSSNVAFRENGGDSFGSVIGAVVSLAIIVVVAMFAVSKYQIVIDKADTNHNQYVERKQLPEEVIGQDQLQFQFAFGVFDYKGGFDGKTRPESVEGQLAMSAEIWSRTAETWKVEQVLTTHKCN